MKQHAHRSAVDGSWPPLPGGRGEPILRAILEDAALLHSLAAEASIGPEIFTFLACQSVIPFAERYAVRLRQHVDAVVIENLAALHLDLAAKREGYHRDTNKLFAL